LAVHAALLSFFPRLASDELLMADLLVGLLAFPWRRVRWRVGRVLVVRALLALLVFLLYAAFVDRHVTPQGWDPAFHVLLVEKLAAGVRPETWEPWEPVRVHYTLGADALVALVVRTTSLAPHEAFADLFPFAYSFLTVTAFGAFRRAARSRLVALYATIALVFLAGEIRLVYHWGGLSTVLALAIALGAAQARSVVAGGLSLGLLPYVHHLTALIVWSSALVLRNRTVLRALGVAVLVALPLVPSVLGGLHDAGTTSIFKFEDEPMRTPLQYFWSKGHWGWGPVLVTLAVLGLGPRKRPRAALTIFLFLVGAHLVLDVGVRLASRLFLHEEFAALTPSRWFQLASVPLALFAGRGAFYLLPRRKHMLLVVVWLVVASIPFNRWEEREIGIDPELFDLALWTKVQIPEDALVVVRARGLSVGELPDRYWWPYLLDHETDQTPLPASEPRLDPRVLSKRALISDPEAARAYARSRGKKLYWLVPSWVPPAPGATRLDIFRSKIALDEG
jgi:hypothetical protein